MKIRQGFVSNSSSSSFVVAYKEDELKNHGYEGDVNDKDSVEYFLAKELNKVYKERFPGLKDEHGNYIPQSRNDKDYMFEDDPKGRKRQIESDKRSYGEEFLGDEVLGLCSPRNVEDSEWCNDSKQFLRSTCKDYNGNIEPWIEDYIESGDLNNDEMIEKILEEDGNDVIMDKLCLDLIKDGFTVEYVNVGNSGEAESAFGNFMDAGDDSRQIDLPWLKVLTDENDNLIKSVKKYYQIQSL
jgi:hypothetical protein